MSTLFYFVVKISNVIFTSLTGEDTDRETDTETINVSAFKI